MKQFILSASIGTATGVQLQPVTGDNVALLINGLVSVATLLIVEVFKEKRAKRNKKKENE